MDGEIPVELKIMATIFYGIAGFTVASWFFTGFQIGKFFWRIIT